MSVDQSGRQRCFAAAAAVACAGGVWCPPRDPVMPQIPGGALIIRFDGDGVLVTDPSGGVDVVRALASDGGFLYLVGADASAGAGDTRWRVEKRDGLTGTLDPSYGTAGILVANPSTGADVATAAVADATHLYVAGFDSGPGDRAWRIEKRRLVDGGLDAGFGTGGVVTANPSSRGDEVAALVLLGTDLYVVGFDEAPGVGDTEWRIERRTATTGALVAAFGTSGVVTRDPSTGSDAATCAAPDATQTALIVAGYDSAPGDREWRVEKLRLGNGAPDGTFGISGVLATNPGSGSDEVRSLDARSGLLLAGTDESPGAGDFQWRVEWRSDTTGALSTSGFGVGGVVGSNPTSGPDEPAFVRWGAAGASVRILIGGTTGGPPAAPGDRGWRVEGRVPTGALDVGQLSLGGGGFGSGGIVQWNPTSGDDALAAGLIGGVTGGSILWLAGTQGGPANPAWRVEARGP